MTSTLSPSGFTVGLTLYAYLLVLFINMFLSVSNIKSSSIKELSINVATNQAVVRYVGSDRPYLYTGVDFDAMTDLAMGAVDSIGKWVNTNLKSVASVQCFAV